MNKLIPTVLGVVRRVKRVERKAAERLPLAVLLELVGALARRRHYQGEPAGFISIEG